jgi:ribosomal peptide maturation radical SAM protein 1
MARHLSIARSAPAPAPMVADGERRLRIALISMPFVGVETPSIQLGILKALAGEAGFSATAFHFSLDFAKRIGPDRYGVLANHRGRLFGDWLFAEAAFGQATPRKSSLFLRDFAHDVELRLSDLGPYPAEQLRDIRKQVSPFLDELVDGIAWSRFDLVAFSSTFQQNTASFALAARLKRRYASIHTLFGGANFDGEMGVELVRGLDFIDYAITGPAERTFVPFLAALTAGEDPAALPGVICRRGGEVSVSTATTEPIDLDALPTPNYDDFFSRAEALGMMDERRRSQTRLPFESSRGCWWGEKHHCTFCGLNAETMAYRTKSAPRVVQELAQQAERYRTFRFEAVDNILPMTYLKDLFPSLTRDGSTYNLFYETKSNLKREQVALLADAGVRTIQPGIESLSTRVLELMRKGVTGIQNVSLLRWARYYDICVIWNVLWGFPGERPGDYAPMVGLLSHLRHLQPPLSASRIWMERFSPIYFDRDRFAVRWVRPERSYAYVYPKSVSAERVAYFFEYEFEDSMPDSYYRALDERVGDWQRAWKATPPPSLVYWSSPDYVVVEDRRTAGTVAKYSLRGGVARLFGRCSSGPVSVETLRKTIDGPPALDETLHELCGQGLIMREGDLVLALPIPARTMDSGSR